MHYSYPHPKIIWFISAAHARADAERPRSSRCFTILELLGDVYAVRVAERVSDVF